MNKDVIYIDVEDDITAIVSKINNSKEKIIALVPPKRIGILQSAVNLRLLARAAHQGDKRLVIITANHALATLAASAKLPVAKNLQSKPEIAQVATAEEADDEDIIDGNDIPVGDHAKQTKRTDDEESIAAAIEAASADATTEPRVTDASTKKSDRKRSKAKVPDFNVFRKKLVLAIVGGIGLIVFLVWALVFAPRATVVVFAKTNDMSVNATVKVSDTFTTSLAKNTIKATKVQKSEKKTIEFAASGSKNIGEKAKGNVELSTSDAATAINGATIPAGTILTSTSGLAFVTDSTVTINPSNYQGAAVTVTAAEQGAKYNAASGSLSGAPANISATFTQASSGGTDKVVKVVTEKDIQKAKEVLTDEKSDEMEAQLKGSLKNAKAIDDSFKVDYTGVTSTPAVGAESQSGNAELSVTVVYVLYGLSDSEVSKYLDDFLKEELGEDSNQRIYKNGSAGVRFQDISNSKNGIELTLVATAKRGPKLDEKEIKRETLGRKTGEIQESLQEIEGIENVEVSYFPFWVGAVPSDEKKVALEFEVDGSN